MEGVNILQMFYLDTPLSGKTFNMAAVIRRGSGAKSRYAAHRGAVLEGAPKRWGGTNLAFSLTAFVHV